MLKKQHRLAKTKDVQKTFARGRGFFNPLFSVKFFRKTTPGIRFTVVVSTKVSKKAVDRNRLKRITREFIRLNISNFTQGDYVISLKPLVKKVPEKEYLEKLSSLLVNARLISLIKNNTNEQFTKNNSKNTSSVGR